jgi:hexosaminidase
VTIVGPRVVPRPTRLDAGDGDLAFGPGLAMSPGPGAAALAAALRRGLAPMFGAALADDPRGTVVEVASCPELGRDAHEIVVSRDAVRVRASSTAAAFHAAQTLRQLAPASTFGGTDGSVTIPCCSIVDAPRFAWRGLMIDVCRHFHPLSTLLRLVDVIALHKMNVLHLHLTEDQAWRVEILGHPRLTEHGAWRTEDDGSRYGGFLTQSELRSLVDYAAERFVTVVPEVEMPGHSKAALSTYPHLSCAGGPFDIPSGPGIYADVYCTKPEVFAFLEEVIGELLDVFPSPFFHVGGDEAPKKRWRACPACQDTIRREGLADEHELQSWFMRRMDRFLTASGRRLLGWDEILDGGLAEGAAVMSWRGTEGGVKAGLAGHDVVMTPHQHCYLDSYPADPRTLPQPQAQPFVRSLRDCWSFDPVTPELVDHAQHVLGGQANLWTEFIPTEEHLFRMALPRLCAIAEATWSQERGTWDDFSDRLDAHLPRLQALGLPFHDAPRTSALGPWERVTDERG